MTAIRVRIDASPPRRAKTATHIRDRIPATIGPCSASAISALLLLLCGNECGKVANDSTDGDSHASIFHRIANELPDAASPNGNRSRARCDHRIMRRVGGVGYRRAVG